MGCCFSWVVPRAFYSVLMTPLFAMFGVLRPRSRLVKATDEELHKTSPTQADPEQGDADVTELRRVAMDKLAEVHAADPHGTDQRYPDQICVENNNNNNNNLLQIPSRSSPHTQHMEITDTTEYVDTMGCIQFDSMTTEGVLGHVPITEYLWDHSINSVSEDAAMAPVTRTDATSTPTIDEVDTKYSPDMGPNRGVPPSAQPPTISPYHLTWPSPLTPEPSGAGVNIDFDHTLWLAVGVGVEEEAPQVSTMTPATNSSRDRSRDREVPMADPPSVTLFI